MAVDIYSVIQPIAYSAGWEVEPLVLASDTIQLSSALHRFTCQVRTESGGGFVLLFNSTALSNELRRKNGELVVHPILDLDVLRTILSDASVLAGSLPNSPLLEFDARIKNLSIDETEVRREVEQRVGQDIYRNHMLSYWEGRCALTNIGESELLLASHAKPWKDCTSAEERLNVFNGFLLEARFDRLFDRGFITFDDQGALIVSKRLELSSLSVLGLKQGMELRWIREEHLPFLHWHQEHVFIR
jgi:predicted restriction endonuclease